MPLAPRNQHPGHGEAFLRSRLAGQSPQSQRNPREIADKVYKGVVCCNGIVWNVALSGSKRMALELSKTRNSRSCDFGNAHIGEGCAVCGDLQYAAEPREQ